MRPAFHCPNGGIGRRVGLKIQCPLKTCRFEPGFGHRDRSAGNFPPPTCLFLSPSPPFLPLRILFCLCLFSPSLYFLLSLLPYHQSTTVSSLLLPPSIPVSSLLSRSPLSLPFILFTISLFSPIIRNHLSLHLFLSLLTSAQTSPFLFPLSPFPLIPAQTSPFLFLKAVREK